ncbi:hypothetical protein BUALT_Bualt05G0164100 [Buddleja alternifolia]|uniref:Uncharacterized protein n=1 Tax=Buddleja alternifolia TaxID=168488 RepID=A0AAV6XVT2_9LAMI|nr:hypothetical protein BUALT_Bualt05G0164100 [Buddleja alternifolia]
MDVDLETYNTNPNGAGWSLSSPCLQECQRYIIAIGISLQFLASTCFVLIRGVGPSDKHYKHWIITYYAVDFICCVTMGLPVLNSIDNYVVNSKTEGKEARRSAQLRVYGNYVLALFVYVGFTRLGMFMIRSLTSYKYWCGTIALELAIELLFYVVVYLMFWPNERNNDYVILGDRGEEKLGSDTLHDFKNGF